MDFGTLTGKRITARLICLTDEDVSLLIGDSVSRVPLANLSAPDLAYLDRLKLGQADLFAGQVMLNSPSWENYPDFRFTITGEHYAALAKRGGDFEGALASALRHVGSKLKTGDWELESFSEVPENAPVHPRSDQPHSGALTKRPYSYVARFALAKKAEKEARRHWPLNISPPSWPSTPGLFVCVLADGEIASVEPYLSNP